MPPRRVVVTAVGAVTPLGVGARTAWQALLQGRSGTRELRRRQTDYVPHGISVCAAAEVPREQYAPRPLRTGSGALPANLSYALDAAGEAVAAAGGAQRLAQHYAAERIGAAIGAGISGLQEILANQAVLLERGARRVSPYLVPHALVNMAAGMVSIEHGFKGPVHAVSTACATGAHAIGDAFRFIKHGDADVGYWEGR